MAARLLTLCAAALLAMAPAARAADDAPTHSAVAAKLDAAEGLRAVKRLHRTYGHYRSDGLWDDLAELFAEDATLQIGDTEITGRAALHAYFMAAADRSGPGLADGQLNQYLELQPIVTLGPDGVTAKGTWHELAMLGRYGDSADWIGGVAEAEYAREGDEWKITRLRFFEQYRGAYADFGHVAPPAWNIDYHFEAGDLGVPVPGAALDALDGAGAPEDPAPLAARARRLADETAVHNLQHVFGYYLDRKMWDDVAELFAADGTYEAAGRGVYAGQARIRAAMPALYGPAPLNIGELFDHIILQTVVSVSPDGRSAAARSTQLSQLGQTGEGARWELGVYENRFVKQDGVWAIQAVRYFPRMAADYDKGWAENAVPAPGPSAEFPPDRAGAADWASYPAAGIVAYHADRLGSRGAAPRPAPGDPASLAEIAGLADAAIAVDAAENLMSSYGYYIDESALDEMAETFASTGYKEISGVGYYVGPERIGEILNRRGPQGGRRATFFTIHQLTQPVFHVSEDGTRVNVRLRLFQLGGSADGSSGSWIGGIYENTAVREDGEWKFGRQDLQHSFNASYREGWARVRPRTGAVGSAARGASFAEGFPPDGPIRSPQYTFPEIVEPAFHYANPVSGRAPPELLP